MGSHRVFRTFWWATNALLALSLLATLSTGIWEHSVRQYLKGFSDAIIPEGSLPRQKAEAILAWMSYGPPRREALDTSVLSAHDPTDTLNYRQLLAVCGSATNAFLNLSRSSGLDARRLLLLSPDRTAKHVVAEVRIDGRWIIVDPTYRVMMKDAQGKLLARTDLQNPRLFQEAVAAIPGYVSIYSYERVAHIRVGALPVLGPYLRRMLDAVLPGWDETLDWSLLLERRSFAFLFLSVWAVIFSLLLRFALAWIADHRLLIPRLRLRTSFTRAAATFFSTPEMK
ncbi:MAG TPA: transglutaminase-like domain-containing protein [Candidatus Limnocylindrales bacterium]|nr:transglutaminase-like domain-containing protein [Candidatus Limnocylindrales bacterium]